jgi:hypothetical protein
MADITMCSNMECDLRLRCYRYMAEPDDLMQSFALFNPRGVDCDWFIQVPHKRDS